ncbi:c-type cytochrome biogenesis protein CcmI [Telmatospirillum sp.]|uniref:c-type cytochrome biogenesis protein CcmI n=1 Tax=Telmatospirillum sp. TaxID=2079197 RepID=UPI002844731C|nr:c-type cytochrome biogenesis protein CcmI [Telmatospirillum sp.]MDR3440206.1 c-type cytochrome biogenesis protein CcmI [Telmatospirillum sp.]
MTLWIVMTGMLLAVLLVLLIPLLRRQVQAPSRVAYDIVVYRDQLAEVDRDVERGLLSSEQAEAARTEILRRMLAAEDAEIEAPQTEYRLAGGRKLRLGAALVILVGLPVGAFGLYGVLGSPWLPGQPFASRQADPDLKMTKLADNLAADLRAKPEADGFVTLAETYFALRRYEEAADAFRQAIGLGSIDAQILASLGESITLQNNGDVVADARQAFQQALTLDHGDPRARFYLGLSKAQTGKFAEAVSIWRDLEKDSPGDAPWLAMLKEHIASYAKQGGFDPATIKPVPPAPEGTKTAEGPNPHADASVPGQVGAADAVLAQSPEERTKTIKSMVEGLAARLAQNPDDADGWQRLARSYKAMGDLDQARSAAERAVKLKPKAVEPKLTLAEIQLAAAKSNRLPADFVETMRAVIALDPANDEAMYYVGAAEAQEGHPDKARKIWSRLLEVLPQDSPHRPELVKQLAGLPKS